MKTIGFIGAFDKTDLIMNVAKTLTELDRRVLVVDTTKLEKSKYIVPSISPTKTYMTRFEGIDFAYGFRNLDELYQYVAMEQEGDVDQLPYDYVLIDIDMRWKIWKI